jgi:hypothetical protein
MSLLFRGEDTICVLNFRLAKTAKSLKQLLFRPKSDVRVPGRQWSGRSRRPFCIIPAGRPCEAPPKVWRYLPRDGGEIEI